MDKFLETYNLPRLNQEETDNLNRPILRIEADFVIKYVQQTKVQDHIHTEEFQQTNKEELIRILLKLFPKVEEEERLPNSIYKTAITLIPKTKILQKKKITDQHH